MKLISIIITQNISNCYTVLLNKKNLRQMQTSWYTKCFLVFFHLYTIYLAAIFRSFMCYKAAEYSCYVYRWKNNPFINRITVILQPMYLSSSKIVIKKIKNIIEILISIMLITNMDRYYLWSDSPLS